jgi:hypothetical protein
VEPPKLKYLSLNQNKVAIINASDYTSIKDYSWFASSDGFNWYVVAHIPGNHSQKIKLQD